MGVGGLYHNILPCGAELGGEHLPDRRVVAVNFTFLCGMTAEPEDQLGVAQLVEDTLDKGTAQYTAEQLADAFDAIGARRSSTTGRETISFGCLVLAEFFERAIELHAGMFCRPTFPPGQCDVARDLSLQELRALEDDPMEMLQKIARRQAMGSVFGRHPLGEKATLEGLGRDQILCYWQRNFAAGSLQVTLAGPIEPSLAAETIEKHFSCLERGRPRGFEPPEVQFVPGRSHTDKDLQQQYMAVSWPGSRRQAADWPAEAVALGVLSGGMSSRLFTEVREKQGLVYWVGAWPDYLRGGGLLTMGASTRPDRGERTCQTLLREMSRLGEDLAADELQRAKALIAARRQTRGELTRVRAGEIAEDLYYFGEPRDRNEETSRIEQVTIDEIRQYLTAHPRSAERLSIVTLGPAGQGEEGGQVTGDREQPAKAG
jgi:predicted Zn-dependent peptidase